MVNWHWLVPPLTAVLNWCIVRTHCTIGCLIRVVPSSHYLSKPLENTYTAFQYLSWVCVKLINGIYRPERLLFDYYSNVSLSNYFVVPLPRVGVCVWGALRLEYNSVYYEAPSKLVPVF